MAFLVTAAAGFLVGLGVNAVVADVLVSIAASVLLNVGKNLLTGGAKLPKQQELKRGLEQITSLPAWRDVYGNDLATGTPIARRVRGKWIVMCWLVNSRPSNGNMTIFMDDREVVFTAGTAADLYDFASDGAHPRDFPFVDHARFWCGLGDQTTPPAAVLSEFPWASGDDEELFLSTDGMQGRTVVWGIMQIGGAGNLAERWPSPTPLLKVRGEFNKVWDPRDETQDMDDPDTWKYTRNHSLNTLDAAMRNPVKPYPIDNILLDLWIAAADVADQNVALKAGGTEKRYTVDGTIVWVDAELEDQLIPLFVAGAANPVRVGGRLGIAPGAYVTPDFTLTHLIDDHGFEYVGNSESPANRVLTNYTSRERDGEPASLTPWNIPGALAADGGLPNLLELDLTFAGSATQAMRVQKIAGLRARRQKLLTCVAPPPAIDLIGGSNVTLDLPAPWNRWDGVYEVQAVHPAYDMVGGQGVAARVPLTILENPSSIFDWDEDADEEDIETETFTAQRAGVSTGGAISVVTGDGANLLTSGETIIPRIRFAFDPSPTAAVDGYPWQYRPTGDYWRDGGVIDAGVLDGDDKVFQFTGELALGESYDIQYAAQRGKSRSAWIGITGVSPVGPDIDLGIPTSGSATGGAGEIAVSFQAPSGTDLRSVEFWGSDTNDENAAGFLANPSASAGATVTFTETGLGASQTRYYFARSRGKFSSASLFTASVSATTDA